MPGVVSLDLELVVHPNRLHIEPREGKTEKGKTEKGKISATSVSRPSFAAQRFELAKGSELVCEEEDGGGHLVQIDGHNL